MSHSPVVSKSAFYLQIHLKAWHQSKNWSERGNVRRRELQSGIPWPPSQWTPCFYTPFSCWVPHACFLESVVARLSLSKGDFHVFTGQRRKLVLLWSILHSRFHGKVNSLATDCRVLVPTLTLNFRTLPKCYFKQYIFQLLSLYSAWKYRSNSYLASVRFGELTVDPRNNQEVQAFFFNLKKCYWNLFISSLFTSFRFPGIKTNVKALFLKRAAVLNLPLIFYPMELDRLIKKISEFLSSLVHKPKDSSKS